MDTRGHAPRTVDDPYINFRPPPEAPVFYPTEEEFTDPLGYIAKIRPIAETTGICKIKPPADWQPPFAVNVEKFKFVPRIQKLNELEAKSRIKLNLLDQLTKFWELQGTPLKIPHVERKLLDLGALRKIVQAEGGYEGVCKERRWARVSAVMGYPPAKGIGSILRDHYKKIIYPYDLFKRGDALDIDGKKKVELEQKPSQQQLPPQSLPSEPKASKEERMDEDVRSNGNVSDSNDSKDGTPGVRKSKRIFKEEPVIDYSANSELRKLQFFGAGPKAAVPSVQKDEKPDVKGGKEFAQTAHTAKTKDKLPPPPGEYGEVDQYLCLVCERGDGEEQMLLCDGCDDAFHTYCLVPPLSDVPKGDWRCPRCIEQLCNRPLDPYGFEQSSREYTLQSFGEMADNFKASFFNRPVHMVTTQDVEKEFWRLVNCLEEDVSVQYGADIHASEMGSGFPTRDTFDILPEDEEYVNSGWNLNNLPILEQSVLCHINADISGMKVPWCYVGMCFSCFCWHNEDHWSYSINYMHWGEPKTWYGVPGSAADKFEDAMRANAPELFEHSPDLLHQLTTIVNPNILSAQDVPIVRTDQHAGEFIITFPRAYHAGFNQGYNFAEAVNFCPADWLPMGRLCIEHYRSLHRQCVFSHEELICKMAADPDSLDLNLAASTYSDMLVIVEEEKKMRKALLDKGTMEAEREAFELLPDDERQCDCCKTTCFLSALTCPCTPSKLVCLHHTDRLCTCHAGRHCLRYRYTLDELPTMLHRLKVRAESFDTWTLNAKNALEATEDSKLDLNALKDLLSEAEEKRYPDSELLQTLQRAISDAEKCASVATQLVSRKVRTRHRQSLEGKHVGKLTMDELKQFYDQVLNLPCTIKETKHLKELLDQVVDFQREAQKALGAATPNSALLENLIELGVTFDVDLPEIPKLKQVLQQAKWLDEVRSSMRDTGEVTLDVMRKLMESGVSLAPHTAVEKAMADLQELLTVSERWEEKARVCLQARPRHIIDTLEGIINETTSIPAYLPNVSALREAVRKAREWTSKVEAIQSGESYPYLDILENYVNKGRPIPVRLELLPQLESQVTAAKSWRDRTARTFLKKNSTFSLLEVLSPRTDVGVYSSSKSKKKKLKEGEKEVEGVPAVEIKTEEVRDPASIKSTLQVQAFKEAEQREVELMRDLRAKNMEKIHNREGDTKYCVCRKSASGFMLQCELCKDWFHGGCVPLPKSATMKNKTTHAAVMQAAKDMKFLCPSCLRSRRPRLETILSLLVSLQKLPVRLPEGEALQCLTERAMAWQDRARQVLTTQELSSALNKLSVLSQRMVEQAAREKTEKIINAELLKAANNPELQGHLATVQQSAFGGAHNGHGPREPQPSSFFTQDTDSSQSPLPPSPQSSHLSDLDLTVEVTETVTSSHGTMSSEHAYSSMSKASTSMSPRKHQRKSPLVPRQLEGPVLELSETARANLEELMMEGDLLEVSLDETQHIWRILQACQPRHEEKYLEFEESDHALIREKPDRERKEKQKKMKEKNKEMEKKKRKKKLSEDGATSEKRIKEEEGSEKLKKKKIKVKDKPNGGMDSKENKAKPKEGSMEKKKEKINEKADKGDKPKKKRRQKPRTEEGGMKRVKKETVRMNSRGEEEEADDENDDDCAASKCLRPIGEEVNWVQCDGCERWFHLLCVGLKDEQVNNEEDYMCFDCHNKQDDDAPTPASQSADSVSNGMVKQEAESAGEEDSMGGPGSSRASREDSQPRACTAVSTTPSTPCHDLSVDGVMPMEVEVMMDIMSARAPAVENSCSDSAAVLEGDAEEEEEDGEEEEEEDGEEEQEMDKVEEVVEEEVVGEEEDGVEDEEDSATSSAVSSAPVSACNSVWDSSQSLNSETREASFVSAIGNVPS